MDLVALPREGGETEEGEGEADLWLDRTTRWQSSTIQI